MVQNIVITAENLNTFSHDKNVVTNELPAPPEMIVMDENLEKVIEVWDGCKEVTELRREELSELKQRYLDELDESGELEEIIGEDKIIMPFFSNADELVDDAVIFAHYAGISFVCEDFWCNLR